MKGKKGFLTILGTLITIAIICALCYFVLNTFVKSPVADKEINKALSHEGIDTSNYRTVLDSTKTTIKDIQKQQADRQEELGIW